VSAIIRPENFGPDAVAPGEWRKTNVAAAVTMALHDLAVTRNIAPGELAGGMVESLIAFIQASNAPSSWREAGHHIAAEIERRMVAR
jgi:hypothetical protein